MQFPTGKELRPWLRLRSEQGCGRRATSVAVKRVALVANEKGGVGKSVFTRTLVDCLRANGQRVAAYDADGSVGATVRVLGTRDVNGSIEREQDPVAGVGYYNGRAENERNILLDSIETGEALYVHDLAGGLLADLTRIVDLGEGLEGLLDAFDVHGYRLTIFHVISPDVGAAQSVRAGSGSSATARIMSRSSI